MAQIHYPGEGISDYFRDHWVDAFPVNSKEVRQEADLAVTYDQPEKLTALLDRGFSVNEGHLLTSAASHNNLPMVEQLLKRGANVNQTGNNGQTALHIAVSHRQKAIVELLLSHGADVNAPFAELPGQRTTSHPNFTTPLTEAVFKDDLEMAALMLDKGANPNLLNRFELTVLDFVLNNNQPHKAAKKKLLLSHGAKTSAELKEKANNDASALGVQNNGSANKTSLPATSRALKRHFDGYGFTTEELKRIRADAVPALTEMLRNESPYKRAAAVKALGDMGDIGRSTIPALAELFQDKDPCVQLAAFDSLKELGFDIRKAISPLGKLASETSSLTVEQAVATKLAEIGPDGVPVLIELLDSKQEITRSTAARTIGQLGRPAKAAVPKLTLLSSDKDTIAQQESIQALEKMGPEAKIAIPALTELLKDKNQRTRAYAVKALGQMEWEPKTAVPVFIEMLGDKYYEVQEYAAMALGQIGPEAKAAIPSLIPLLL